MEIFESSSIGQERSKCCPFTVELIAFFARDGAIEIAISSEVTPLSNFF
jgi:hypothetical protein